MNEPNTLTASTANMPAQPACDSKPAACTAAPAPAPAAQPKPQIVPKTSRRQPRKQH